jgi:hypothetical protein
MTEPIIVGWSMCSIAEAVLMIRVWRNLRAMYGTFFLYLLTDLVAALFLAGVVLTVPWDYQIGYTATELVMVGFQCAITIEAVRRANSLLNFRPGNILLALVAALGSAWAAQHLLHSPNPWPESPLVPVNEARASVEMFLGLVTLFLVAMPGRKACVRQFQGKHLTILSSYLLFSALLVFFEDFLYSKTPHATIPYGLDMFLTAGFFVVWALAVPRDKPVPQPA